MKKEFVLWTDGSALENGNPSSPGGYAYLIQEVVDGNIKKETTNSKGVSNTTNNRMEMEAVINGLKKIRSKKTSKVTVKTDSKLIVNGVNEWRGSWEKRNFKNIKNLDLWKKLYNELDKFSDINVQHVKAHSGIRENEICDTLSREVAKNDKR